MINRKAVLTQARKGIQATINTNKITVTMWRKAKHDDGFGKLVENQAATPDPYQRTCKISHEQEGTFKNSETPSGLGTQYDRYILCDWLNEIQEYDIFEDDDSRRWAVGPVDVLRQGGGIIGYQAVLMRADL